jgi:hypothetical protein
LINGLPQSFAFAHAPYGLEKAQRATDRPCLRKALRYDPGGFDAPIIRSCKKVFVLKEGRGRAYDGVGYAISVY